MDLFTTIVQVSIALVILNVWLLRREMSTDYRGGQAKNMTEEFAVYGLPRWFMVTTGILKVSLAAALIAGVWFPQLTKPAAAAMGLLMLGAVIMHIKVRDPVKKATPALALLILCLIVAAV